MDCYVNRIHCLIATYRCKQKVDSLCIYLVTMAVHGRLERPAVMGGARLHVNEGLISSLVL